MRPIAMGTDVRDVKRFGLWIKSVGQEQPLLGFCACVFLLASLLIVPSRLQAEESSVAPAQSSADPAKVPTSKSPAAPPKEPSQIPVISQESKPPQQKSQVSAIEEPKAKGDKKGEEVKGDKKGEEAKGDKKGEEVKEKEKNGAGKRTVSSLILTVKLTLLAD